MRPTLLDCTLRDGGNQNDWRFTPRDVTTIVSTLDKAGVDIIEVGYRGGSGSRRSDTAGPSAHCTPEYLRALPDVRHAELAVMVVPTVCPPDALDDLRDNGIDLVRVAAYPWNVAGVPPFLKRARRLGLRTSVNLMAVSYVDLSALADIVGQIRDDGPDLFYVADSFGRLTPDAVGERIGLLASELSCPIGIHAHNNLGLAVANALAAVDAGATFVDASLCAMARGAGNVATEQAAAILTAWSRFDSRIDLAEVCRAAEYVSDHVLPAPMLVGTSEIAAGLHDHHYYFQALVDRFSAEHHLDPWEVGRRLGATRPHKVAPEAVERACADLVAIAH